MKVRKLVKSILWSFVMIFAFMNLIAFFHAYKFTHYTDEKVIKTKVERLSTIKKIQTLLFGIDNPRPVNGILPKEAFNTFNLQSNKVIECWHIQTENSKGTIILFHGYGGNKSSLIGKSNEFIKQGYSTLLVDFMGSGGSEGNQTTIGFKEAEEVKTCFDYLKKTGENNIYLFGTSLGAVAIMKSINDYSIKPKGIIIECPFGSMYQTTCARFRTMRVPIFPMAGLLVFWGGIQNGFWAFGHNPINYANKITCPTLLLYGEQDDKVSRAEIENIYSNLLGKKILKTYPLAGHEDYLIKYKQDWIEDVSAFLNQ
ncbi:alpha/beta hydrolase [Parasediminibacterium sp. JCM 36343]|uniref:alpha/beta hydrolase n=1 Tax=Parasediminibacterium sp. JCM 36343 TaxID=3374279 RepID=UPI00397D6674